MTVATVERAIGRLEGGMQALVQAIQKQGEAVEKQGEQVQLLVDSQAARDARLKALEDKIAKIEPLANDYGQLKQRGLGVFAAIIFIWAIVGNTIVSYFGSLVQTVVKLFTAAG